MDPVFTIIVIVLLALGIMGLIVGVSNDAVNFLNSAIGSKAAPRKVIMAVASVGIIVGAMTSSGMMEVARSGVFYPQMFTFRDVMMLFLGVMFANVILLDLFNTVGLPTSTTVSLVFGLLGSAIAVASVKIWGTDELTMADLTDYINSGKAMAIISAILISVVIAFVFGTIIMYITRVIFTFRYHKVFGRLGAMWCGIALAAIVYFALFKGLKGTFILPKGGEVLTWMEGNMLFFVFLVWLACSGVMAFFQHVLKVNILRITILAGTFSLALAFAGNDLVNFIGVPIAGYDSYKIAASSGATDMMMGDLNKPVVANFLFLVAAGLIMVITLWTSKKAQTVSDTEINLAKQDTGVERFGSTLMSRGVVRLALNANKTYEKWMPEGVQRYLEKRFLPLRPSEMEADRAPFDMIRATVNLTVASLLIATATSLKLPLSTTYVTFMVAMGSSLADRACGRESAVYRITGVLTVISGWFLTALIAFVIAYAVSIGLMHGGTVAVLAMTLICVLLIVQSNMAHKRKAVKQETVVERQADFSTEDSPAAIIEKCTDVVRNFMMQTTDIYQRTMQGMYDEDRKGLKACVKESEDLYIEARDRKYHMLSALHALNEAYAYAGNYYVQVVDYIGEMTKALVHITRPCFAHIDNNHEGLTRDQVEDLTAINNEVAAIFGKVNEMLRANDFDNLNVILDMRDHLFDTIAGAMTRQLRRIKHRSASTKTSLLYITILNETKNMILQSRNLLKSQKYFVETSEDIESLED
ncbi:MAG: inorganic phosphate transporter [Rikenellaceae bacterium]|jgi:phosphate/sulfate permease|nr:inorganic phosphate transporter [Rikenellaceae bacterium]